MADPSTSTILLSGVTAAAIASLSPITVAIINSRSKRDDNIALACAVLLADADKKVTQAWRIGGLLSPDRSAQKSESLSALVDANHYPDEVRLAKGSLQQEGRRRQLLVDYEAVIDAFKLYMACVAAAATAEGEQPRDMLEGDRDAFHQAILQFKDTAAGRRPPRAPSRIAGLRRSAARRLGRAA